MVTDAPPEDGLEAITVSPCVEVPIADNPGSDMQSETDPPSTTLIANDTEADLTDVPVQMGKGADQPRSYLDSESCPTNNAVETAAVPVNHGGAQDPNTEAPVPARQTSPTTERASISRLNHYGPWMIAPRRERRQVGRPSGPGHNNHSGKAKEPTAASGSRFAPLDTDDQLAMNGVEEHGGKLEEMAWATTRRYMKRSELKKGQELMNKVKVNLPP
nr:hypothetical protein Iba_chr11aCG10420 [Ipomoea batatas]